MKHYKNDKDEVFGFSEDQEVPVGLVEITKTQADILGVQNYEKKKAAEFEKLDYVRQRVHSYPNLGEFVDAWVKGDNEALEAYRAECLAVKAKYPKPAGF
jgi:cell fate (sporulation/competence/biofilm development) regulator YmcA (YheA/YmcA/DUF963 family)